MQSLLELYPQHRAKENPHTALCDATSGFYTYPETYEDAHDLFVIVLDIGGISLNYSCFISCEYQAEFMEKPNSPVPADEEIKTKIENGDRIESRPLPQLKFLRWGVRILLAICLVMIFRECQSGSANDNKSPSSQMLESILDKTNQQ